MPLQGVVGASQRGHHKARILFPVDMFRVLATTRRVQSQPPFFLSFFVLHLNSVNTRDAYRSGSTVRSPHTSGARSSVAASGCGPVQTRNPRRCFHTNSSTRRGRSRNRRATQTFTSGHAARICATMRPISVRQHHGWLSAVRTERVRRRRRKAEDSNSGRNIRGKPPSRSPCEGRSVVSISSTISVGLLGCASIKTFTSS